MTTTTSSATTGPALAATSAPQLPGVVIYAQGERPAQIAQQQERLRRYCQDHRLDIITEFCDLDTRTTGIDLMLHAATQPYVDYVCVTAWPPANLDDEDALSVVEILEHYQVGLVVLGEESEVEPPSGAAAVSLRRSA